MKKFIIACALMLSFGAAASAQPMVVARGPMVSRGYQPAPAYQPVRHGNAPRYAGGPRYAGPQVVVQPAVYYPGPRAAYGYGYGYGGYGYAAPQMSAGAVLALTTLGVVLPTLAILATR